MRQKGKLYVPLISLSLLDVYEWSLEFVHTLVWKSADCLTFFESGGWVCQPSIYLLCLWLCLFFYLSTYVRVLLTGKASFQTLKLLLNSIWQCWLIFWTTRLHRTLHRRDKLPCFSFFNFCFQCTKHPRLFGNRTEMKLEWFSLINFSFSVIKCTSLFRIDRDF